jgi:hypothetical protein
MRAAIRYLRAWLLSALLLIGAVAVFNLLVDPYGLFRLITIDEFNRIKSQAGHRAEMFKRHSAERVRPNALILGNSRAEVGFDPDSTAWPLQMRPVFNLALPGTGPDTALQQFRDVLRHTMPQLIIVGLDFLDFRTDQVVPVVLPLAAFNTSTGYANMSRHSSPLARLSIRSSR